MQGLKRLIESYLGVPAPQPGQGSRWDFTAQPPWPSWLPDWVVFLAGVAVVALVAGVYLRDARSATPGRKIALTLLRVAAVGLALLFLSEWTLSVERTGLPEIVVLIDDSASMKLDDHYPDKQTAAHVRELVEEAGFEQATRLNLVKAVLSRNGGRFLKRLLENHKLHIYRFSETAAPLDRGEFLQPEGIDALLPVMREELQPLGRETSHGPATEKVLQDLSGTAPSAIIVLTDGITTTGRDDRLSRAARLAESRSVPLYTVGIGSSQPARDLEVYGLLAPEVAFVDDPVNFTFDLKAFGVEKGTVSVVLKQKDSGRVLAGRAVGPVEEGRPRKVELTYTPAEDGEFDFVVEARPLPGESNTANNAQTVHVSVRREKLRVLLVDSAPRYEYRYVKHLLERDKTIELHTALLEADLEYAAQDDTAAPLKGRFPVERETLFGYDVVIFGDVDPRTLHADVFANLHGFVREAGGGMIVVSGPMYTPLEYRGTRLETLLPVRLEDARAAGAEPITDGFRVEVTVDGLKRSGMFHFGESEADSLEVIKNLPELYWLVETPTLKPGAVVFARKPARGASADGLPVVAMQRFGAGKVIFHASDELWRWRFRAGDLYYGRYWIQAIRFLCRSKLLGKTRAAVLESDRKVYEQGESVQLTLRFFDEKAQPAEDEESAAIVERRGGGRERLSLSRIKSQPGAFQGRLSRASEGAYHAWVVTPAFENAPPSTSFLVEAPRRELQVRSMDETEIKEAARISHGKSYTILDVDNLPDEVPAGRAIPLEKPFSVPLWNRWELMVLFAGVLLAEWLLRKRLRLV